MSELRVNKLKSIVNDAIKSVLNGDLADFEAYSMLSIPPQIENGDLCFPCFALSKALKMKPNEIANDLKDKIIANNTGHFESVSSMGPYLNFKFQSKVLFELSSFEKELFAKKRKVMLEYSQPNTHKELHVGHMRNLCLGNSLAKIYDYSGHHVLEATYPGDVGTHVAKALWYLARNPEDKAPETRKGAWLGKVYSKAHAQLELERGSEKEEKNREELTQILKEIKVGSGEYYDRWVETRQWSLDQMKEIYKWSDVSFDEWFFESGVDKPSLKLVDEYFEKGLFVKDQGAIGISLEEEKLGFFLLKKSDGNGLYSTKDLELARKKFEDFKIEENIYIVDSRQSRHFQQVFKTLEKMGFPQAKDCYHLSYAFVELPDGAMSSRQGNIVPLQSLLDQMEETIKTRYLNRYTDWSQSEIDETACVIANGAIKYGMCRIDSQKKIVFDMEEWLKLDGNSGPYLQYSFARANSILSKFEKSDSFDSSLLTHDLEKKILLELNFFDEKVQECVIKKTPHLICNYLYSLAQDFNRYYAAVNISQSESDVQNARLHFVEKFCERLEKGLGLLGIKAPQRM